MLRQITKLWSQSWKNLCTSSQRDVKLLYKKGAELNIADTLSRALLRDTAQSFDEQDQFVVITMDLRISESIQAELATATKPPQQRTFAKLSSPSYPIWNCWCWFVPLEWNWIPCHRRFLFHLVWLSLPGRHHFSQSHKETKKTVLKPWSPALPHQ